MGGLEDHRVLDMVSLEAYVLRVFLAYAYFRTCTLQRVSLFLRGLRSRFISICKADATESRCFRG